MNDHDFLVWLRGRLINVYHESEHVDFVHRLEEVIGNIDRLEAISAKLKVLIDTLKEK
jgi:hypothetical protein